MLTDTAIRAAKPREKSYKLFDALGLYLEVAPTGSKLWRLPPRWPREPPRSGRASRRIIETSARAPRRGAQVFRYAVKTARAERDPTVYLKGALAPMVKEHHAAIKGPARIGELLQAIDSYAGHVVTAYALKLAPLLFVRPGELRHAE